MSGAVYPFTAIVGQERLRLALLLVAVYPQIGGVLIRGGKGTAKSTAARGLARLLPDVEAVAGCPFRCDPGRPADLCEACRERWAREGSLPRERVPAPFVELPLGATEDRVLGTLDLARALREGRRDFEPGLLARAHRGILYVDEVNLLPDHLVDVLLDVAASGVHVVEREGVSVRHPASFVLIGTMNPEEGELRPQFLDRFGLAVDAEGLGDAELRAEAVRRRIAFERDPEGFCRQWAAREEAERARIAAARARLPLVRVDDDLLRRIGRICLDAGVEGLRADLVVYKAAVALAAYEGRERVSPDDVREAAALALPHRRRRQPFDDPRAGDEELRRVLDRHLPPGRPREPVRVPGGEREGGDGSPDGDGAGSGPEGDGPGGPPGDRGRGLAPWRVDPPGPLPRPASITLRGRGRPAGDPGRRAEGAGAGPRGRPEGVRAAGGGPARDLALAATLRAAALRTRGAGPGGLEVEPADLRVWRRRVQRAARVLFLLDASGSMGVARRMGATKAAMLSLLREAYRRRDRVGLAVCRGSGAELVLPFTRSVERARRALEHLPTGGRTPLAAGLALALDVLLRERRRVPGVPLLLVLVTDGKANVALASADPYAEARAWARRLASAGIPAVVADAADPREPLPLAAGLAAEMGAVRLRLEELEGRRLVRILTAWGG